VTLFGSYKKAFKSGSFSIATPPVRGLDNSFGDEEVKGGEIGLKSRLLDRTLLFNISAYDYKYTGLQVGNVEPVQGGIPVIKTVNAGSATSKGVEAEVVYHPPQIPALSLHGDIAYNDSRYNKLNNIPCFGGQRIAEGCDLVFSQAQNGGLGGFTAQDVSGLPLIRAAKWQANFGFDWETDVGRDMKLIVVNSQQYSSRQLVNLALPIYQKGFIKADLSFILQGPRDRWELALIGRNLTNRITTGACTNQLPGRQPAGHPVHGHQSRRARGARRNRLHPRPRP